MRLTKSKNYRANSYLRKVLLQRLIIEIYGENENEIITYYLRSVKCEFTNGHTGDVQFSIISSESFD